MSRRSWALVTGGVVLGIGVGLRFPSPARVEFVGGGAFLPSPEVELGTLIREVPFDARLPSRVPEDLSLYEIGNSGPDADGLIHSFDVKYRSRNNRPTRLHVWQTLNPDLPKLPESNPLSPTYGKRIEIAGSEWRLVKLDWPSDYPITELHHLFDDGVYLSVDGQGLKTAQLVEVAQSLVVVNSISSEWLERLGLVRD